jgi:hypothetical protein
MIKKIIFGMVCMFFSLTIRSPLTAVGEPTCEVVLPSSVQGTRAGDQVLVRGVASFLGEIAKKDSITFRYADLRTVNPEIGPPAYEKLALYTREFRNTQNITSQVWREHFRNYTSQRVDLRLHLCEISSPYIFFVQSTTPSPFFKEGEAIQFSARVGVIFFYGDLRIAEVYDVIFHTQDGTGRGNTVEGMILRDGRILKQE